MYQIDRDLSVDDPSLVLKKDRVLPLYIDSQWVVGGDTFYSNQLTYGKDVNLDGFQSTDTSCSDIYSWVGTPRYVDSLSQWTTSNRWHDELIIPSGIDSTQVLWSQGDSTLTAVFIESTELELYGNLDSVRRYMLVLDTNGEVISNDSFYSSEIILSKQHSLITSPVFYLLPRYMVSLDQLSMNGKGSPVPKLSKFYDYPLGTEVEFTEYRSIAEYDNDWSDWNYLERVNERYHCIVVSQDSVGNYLDRLELNCDKETRRWYYTYDWQLRRLDSVTVKNEFDIIEWIEPQKIGIQQVGRGSEVKLIDDTVTWRFISSQCVETMFSPQDSCPLSQFSHSLCYGPKISEIFKYGLGLVSRKNRNTVAYSSQNTYTRYVNDFKLRYLKNDSLEFGSEGPVVGSDWITERVSPRIHVYPNPTSSHIYLRSEFKIEEAQLVDVMGREVLSTRDADYISLQSARPGVYMLILTFQDGSTQTQRIVKRAH